MREYQVALLIISVWNRLVETKNQQDSLTPFQLSKEVFKGLQLSSGDNQLERRWPLSLHHIYSCCHLARQFLETFPVPNQDWFMAQQGTISKGGAILHLQHSEKLLWKLNCAKNCQVLNDLCVGHLHRTWSQVRGASSHPSSWRLQGMGEISAPCLVGWSNALLWFECAKCLQFTPKIDGSMSSLPCRQNTIIWVNIVIPGIAEDLFYLALRGKKVICSLHDSQLSN